MGVCNVSEPPPLLRIDPAVIKMQADESSGGVFYRSPPIYRCDEPPLEIQSFECDG